MKKKTTLLNIFFFVSIFANFFLSYKVLKKTQETAVTLPIVHTQENTKDVQEFVSTVFVLPHPPDFLEGKKIRFLSYTTHKDKGKKWILFKEKTNKGYKETRVDAEAIRWF
ncbi:hypothetical protein EHQ76_08720 [Leptospira barantonii]|uniref:Uncharacterized protein n=1 Tax=Leptospira barantonii TaxID=2023184 RepID=A0A5F2BDR5_9LEPT|nr:hypothetical protein [Leptospira barantonii]TGM03719.1 hypothetical protein EHQ76_08720 [Leptospira barantonii]